MDKLYKLFNLQSITVRPSRPCQCHLSSSSGNYYRPPYRRHQLPGRRIVGWHCRMAWKMCPHDHKIALEFIHNTSPSHSMKFTYHSQQIFCLHLLRPTALSTLVPAWSKSSFALLHGHSALYTQWQTNHPGIHSFCGERKYYRICWPDVWSQRRRRLGFFCNSKCHDFWPGLWVWWCSSSARSKLFLSESQFPWKI